MAGGGPDPQGVLVAFARDLGSCESAEAVLQHLGDRVCELLELGGVGVLLSDDGDLSVATTNSELGEVAERLEVELGQGPCIEALRAGAVVPVPDLQRSAERYPDFVPRALEAGIGSVHGIPLSGRGEMVGVLDLVHGTPRELTAADLAVAQMLADVAVSYIFSVRMHEQSSLLATQLQRALDTRVVIEQAKGILAERHGEPLPAAFERLRRRARSTSTPVRDIAAAVIAGELQL